MIVPAYGVASVLGEALASIQAQTFQDWEAVVVDDGSPDDVTAAFAPFLDDRRFRLLKTAHQGVSAARNHAIGACASPLIALLDGDDAYDPAYLEQMVARIDDDPTLAFVSCDALVFGSHPQAGQMYSAKHALAGPVTLRRVLSRETNIFVAVIIRRAAFNQVGGFDTRLAASEDLDLWIRMLSAGWTAAMLPKPLVRYRRRAGSLSSSHHRLVSTNCAVYRKACAALIGGDESQTAERMLAACETELRWLDGEALVLNGNTHEGLTLLAGATARSWRWRLAIFWMRRTPRLAAAMLRARRWAPEPRRWPHFNALKTRLPAPAASPIKR